MKPDRLSRLREIVLTAAALPDDQRPDYLDETCAGDQELRREAESLLMHEADAPRLSGVAGMRSVMDALRDTVVRPDAPPLPERIGPYRILGILGQGGMGTVYRAEQVEPIRREVALKLIRYGADSAAVLARFESERQTLALMDHPNVARVLDADADEAGRPYFVMEMIRGEPVTTYCETHQLAIRQRLMLFLDVCRGVRHAHRKGVIHRDIKPSNVLVGEAHARPLPRVIDFSIAKSLGEPWLGREYRTRTGQVVGTLEYMSPEQALGDSARIDTRSDVYSLGVLAYEILTGRLPHDTRGVPLHEAVRRIAEIPPRPLRSAGTTTGRIDADVDTIIGKCLEKEPERRYGTAGELVEDLERYLDSRPILGRPPSTAYAVRMLVKRRRGSVIAAAALLLALAGGAAGTGFGFLRARSEAERARSEAAIAEAVNRFLNEDLLAAANPGNQGPDVTVREVLDVAAERLEGKFPRQPLVEAAARATIGQTYTALGEYREAVRQLRIAIDLERASPGVPRPELYKALSALGWALQHLGRYDEADEVLRESVEGMRRLLGVEHADTLAAMSNRAVVLWRRGLNEQAEALNREGLEIKLRTVGESDETTLATKTNLAIVLITMGRSDEAGPLFESVFEERRRAMGPSHPNTLNAMHNLAKFYVVTGRPEVADKLLTELLQELRRVLGDEHPKTLSALVEQAMYDAGRGRFADAERRLKAVFELQMDVLGPDVADTWRTMQRLGEIYLEAGRTSDAERVLTETAEGQQLGLGEEHTDRLLALETLAQLYADTGRLDRAEPLFRDVLDVKQRVLGADRPWTLETMHRLASVLVNAGRDDEADELLTDLLERRRRVQGPAHSTTVESAVLLARLAARRGEPERAVDVLADLVENGWTDLPRLESEPLAGLTGDVRFDALVAEMRRRAEDAGGSGR